MLVCLLGSELFGWQEARVELRLLGAECTARGQQKWRAGEETRTQRIGTKRNAGLAAERMG